MTSSRSRRRRNEAIALLALLVAIAFQVTGAAALPVIASAGFPNSAEAGLPIHVSIEITSPVPVRESEGVVLHYRNPGTGAEDWVQMSLGPGTLSNGTWSYDIPAQPYEGALECRVTVTDQGGGTVQYPASGNHVIQIIGAEAPRPFPWNLVIVVAFLAVALVLTELVFKPGLYRKTGRERARELEEQDRESEAAGSEHQADPKKGD